MNEPTERVDELAYAVIGAAIEVHRHLGPGFLESVYEEAMAVELNLCGIPFERQKPVALNYKGQLVGESRLDFLVDKVLGVELKAIEEFAEIHRAIMISYLKATHCTLGLLINFNVPVLKDGVKRIVHSQ